MKHMKIKSMQNIVKKINKLKETYHKYTNEELMSLSMKLKERAKAEKLDDLVVEGFALVREATRRALGKEHYDVQLLSGLVLFQNKIAEAKTGEGKSITIYLPAYLASLENKGVHIITVNDYLANRDANEARKVFELLGVKVGCISHTSSTQERQEAYNSDITYVTNSEIGFDYLKDNITIKEENLVLRDLHYAIIDEVDSILIDEAKTPLIISGMGEDPSSLLLSADLFVSQLEEGMLIETNGAKKLLGEASLESNDFVRNEKENKIYLTEKGLKKVEQVFGKQDYSSSNSLLLQKAINNALRARYMMKKDIDYVVRNDKIELIDKFTGRVLEGRRYSDGLHQALERKENVTIQRENITLASITFQSFFNKYHKKAGLTGTALSSSKEFKEVYNLDVIPIPTNKPIIRKDLNDLVFKTKEDKWKAIVEEVQKTHLIGQPILIGTTSIEDSELLSQMLTQHHIEHNVLNAKNEELEASIISKAGEFKSVTVATNMAGRGTDIIIDEKAREVGGLKVIGSERHDSRRIDDQLIGRAGRQGDVGSSQFFISFEDRLLRVFGEQSPTILALAPQGKPLEMKAITKMVAKAQATIEGENRLIRESMIKFDQSDNEHREQIYKQRYQILTSQNPRSILQDMFNDLSDEILDRNIDPSTPSQEWKVDKIVNEYFDTFIPLNLNLNLEKMSLENFKKALHQLNSLLIDNREKDIGDEFVALSVAKNVMLRFIDRNWATFLNSMDCVKQNIHVQSYGQKDPSIEYKKQGVTLFNSMIEDIKKDIVKNYLTCIVNVAPLEETLEE